MNLTREQILEADDRKTEAVSVPEWGGEVTVRALSGAERDAYEASIVTLGPNGSKSVNMQNLRGRLVSLSVVDDEGKRLFTDADAIALGNKSAAALERVFDKARQLSGLSENDVEELAEAFEPAPSGGSTSA